MFWKSPFWFFQAIAHFLLFLKNIEESHGGSSFELTDQISGNVFKVKAQDLGNTILLHGHAVQHISCFHGAAAVGDNDELGAFGHAAQILRIARNVHIVQCSFNFVQDAERRRVDGQNGKINADGHQRLFAAGQSRQVLMTLPGGET